MEADFIRVFLNRVHRFGDKPLYSFLDRNTSVCEQITFTDLYASVLPLAAALQRRGLSRKPIGLLFPHGSEFILAFYACILAGAIPIPLVKPRGRQTAALFRILRNSGTSVVFTSDQLRQTCATAGAHTTDSRPFNG